MEFERILALAASAPRGLYNLHSHTQFCDGRDPMDALARAACDCGMTLWGFTPHSPVPSEVSSTCNMSAEAVDHYLAEARRLRSLYAGRMEVLASMEIDYISPRWGPASDYFRSLPLDYRLASVHFLRTRRGDIIDVDGRPEKFLRNLADRFRGDLRYVVEAYFGAQAEMIDLGGFDMLGHMDKVRLNASFADPHVEERDWYLRALDQVVEMVCERRLCTEINTKHHDLYGVIFPSPSVVARLKDAGVPLVVNSDAHRASLVNASRPLGLALLDSPQPLDT